MLVPLMAGFTVRVREWSRRNDKGFERLRFTVSLQKGPRFRQ